MEEISPVTWARTNPDHYATEGAGMIYRRNAFWRVLLVGLFVLVNTPAAGKAEPDGQTGASESRPDMAAMAAL